MIDIQGIQTVTEVYYSQIKQLASRIQPGMTRAQVDAMFPYSNGGIQGTMITIYPQAQGAKVEVPFDNLEGSGSPNNRVIGPAKIFLELGDNYKFYRRQK